MQKNWHSWYMYIDHLAKKLALLVHVDRPPWHLGLKLDTLSGSSKTNYITSLMACSKFFQHHIFTHILGTKIEISNCWPEYLEATLSPRLGIAESNISWHFRYPLLVKKQIRVNLISFLRLSVTEMTSLIF